MAVSFVASGVVWRWLLNSQPGRDAPRGLNRLFEMIGLPFLAEQLVEQRRASGIAAIAIPAIWQLSGYVMALFLAGFRGIPEELREAARVDGASDVADVPPRDLPAAEPRRAVGDHHRRATCRSRSFDLIMSISEAGELPDQGAAIDMYVFKSSFDYANAAADRRDPARASSRC